MYELHIFDLREKEQRVLKMATVSQSFFGSSRFLKDTILTLPMMHVVRPTKFCSQNIVFIFSSYYGHTQKKRNNSYTKFGGCKQSVL